MLAGIWLLNGAGGAGGQRQRLDSSALPEIPATGSREGNEQRVTRHDGPFERAAPRAPGGCAPCHPCPTQPPPARAADGEATWTSEYCAPSALTRAGARGGPGTRASRSPSSSRASLQREDLSL